MTSSWRRRTQVSVGLSGVQPWDQWLERPELWLWSNGLLRRFRWQRQGDQLELRSEPQ